MSRRALLASAICFAIACSEDPKPAPMGMPDARVQRGYDASDVDGSWTEHVMGMRDPLDPVDTEETPILDLPLVVARPRGPRSSATIDVHVLDGEGRPLPDIAVSAGGAAAVTSRAGLAFLSEVYGDGLSEVYAFAPGWTIGHARVAIRADERSAIEIVLAHSHAQRVLELSEAQAVALREPPPPPSLDAGVESADASVDAAIEEPEPLVTLAWGADSFEYVWGGTVRGAGSVRAALMHAPHDAAAVPGAMIAFLDGERVPLAAHMALELRVLQGAADVVVKGEVEASFDWPAGRAPGASALLNVYRFEPERGAFVADGTLARTANGARLTLARLGHYVIGAPAETTRCARASVQAELAPLAYAGVLAVADTGFAAARATADAAGVACAALHEGDAASTRAIGLTSADEIAYGAAPVALVPPLAQGSAQCDATACAAVQVIADAIDLSCVRARVSQAGAAFSVYIDGELTDLELSTGETCIDVVAGSALSFRGGSHRGTCTIDAVAEPNQGLCSTSACTDAGALECCLEREHCDTPLVDDDCDGLVNEGCYCGAVAGACATTILENCCTAQETCGALSPYTAACLGHTTYYPAVLSCPSAMVPFGNGDTITALGCCAVTAECGLLSPDVDFGCVVPAVASELWGPSVVLSSMSCTPPP